MSRPFRQPGSPDRRRARNSGGIGEMRHLHCWQALTRHAEGPLRPDARVCLALKERSGEPLPEPTESHEVGKEQLMRCP